MPVSALTPPVTHYFDSADELVGWIRESDESDFQHHHFLSTARRLDNLITVDTKAGSNFELMSIGVMRNGENMTYVFEHEKDRIVISVSLANVDPEMRSIEESMAEMELSWDNLDVQSVQFENFRISDKTTEEENELISDLHPRKSNKKHVDFGRKSITDMVN
jgi:hypothetical protein